jgi:hypothetical protein
MIAFDSTKPLPAKVAALFFLLQTWPRKPRGIETT